MSGPHPISWKHLEAELGFPSSSSQEEEILPEDIESIPAQEFPYCECALQTSDLPAPNYISQFLQINLSSLSDQFCFSGRPWLLQ